MKIEIEETEAEPMIIGEKQYPNLNITINWKNIDLSVKLAEWTERVYNFSNRKGDEK